MGRQGVRRRDLGQFGARALRHRVGGALLYPVAMQHLPVAVVVLATVTGLLAWGWTVASCGAVAAVERAVTAEAAAGKLERLLRARGRTLHALADMLAGR